jgi:roadblock/LC7 domain-containing protein
MNIVSDLAEMPGVISAGEYSYRGDRFSYRGHMEEEQARQASIMCRATTMSVRMQTDILASFCKDGCGLSPSKGWVVKGPKFTVCVVANVFCFLDESQGSLNDVLGYMREQLKDASDALV